MTVTLLELDTTTGEQNPVGHFHWDGSEGRGVTIEPASQKNSQLLHNVYSETVHDFRTGQTLSPKTDPEKWMNALHRQFTSPYLRATKPH